MSKLLSPEEWYSNATSGTGCMTDEVEVEIFKKYAEHIRDTTLEVASEKAKVDWIDIDVVNKDSILSLKNHEDLKI